MTWKPSLVITPTYVAYRDPHYISLLHGILPVYGIIYSTSKPSASTMMPQLPQALHLCINIPLSDTSVIWCNSRHRYKNFVMINISNLIRLTVSDFIRLTISDSIWLSFSNLIQIPWHELIFYLSHIIWIPLHSSFRNLHICHIVKTIIQQQNRGIFQNSKNSY